MDADADAELAEAALVLVEVALVAVPDAIDALEEASAAPLALSEDCPDAADDDAALELLTPAVDAPVEALCDDGAAELEQAHNKHARAQVAKTMVMRASDEVIVNS